MHDVMSKNTLLPSKKTQPQTSKRPTSMVWRPLASLGCGGKDGFARACGILTERLHVVNRRLVGCELVLEEANLSLHSAAALLERLHRQYAEEGNDDKAEHSAKRPHTTPMAAPASTESPAESPTESPTITSLLTDVLTTTASVASTTSSAPANSGPAAPPMLTVKVRKLISRMPKAFPHTFDAVVTSADGKALTVVPLSGIDSFTYVQINSERGPERAERECALFSFFAARAHYCICSMLLPVPRLDHLGMALAHAID